MLDPAEARWHPIAAADDLPFRHVFHGQLLGREFAVWRADDGYVNVWENRCLHRGVRLSIGINDGRELKCQYHGWRYSNRTAGCTYIPAHPADAPARTITNRTYPGRRALRPRLVRRRAARRGARCRRAARRRAARAARHPGQCAGGPSGGQAEGRIVSSPAAASTETTPRSPSRRRRTLPWRCARRMTARRSASSSSSRSIPAGRSSAACSISEADGGNSHRRPAPPQ